MDEIRAGEVLAVIPARGGSKSIPRKNILPFAGHPLLAYSIAAALQSDLVTRTIVSTDDEEIAAVARQYGAEVPFLRPAEHAQDATPDLPVFVHAVEWFRETEGYLPEMVVQLRPTTPVRPPGCVDDGIKVLRARPDADSLRAVVPSGQNPHKMWRINRRWRDVAAADCRWRLPNRTMLPANTCRRPTGRPATWISSARRPCWRRNR